jgi:hypothetical protein
LKASQLERQNTAANQQKRAFFSSKLKRKSGEISSKSAVSTQLMLLSGNKPHSEINNLF